MRAVKDKDLPGDAIAIEIFEPSVEIPKTASEDRLLARTGEFSVGRSELDRRAIELERMAAVGEQVNPKRRSFQSLDHSYMAVYVDDLHDVSSQSELLMLKMSIVL